METNEDFRTLTGYRQKEQNPVTEAMEDYLEMICRLCQKEKFVRIQDLADALHVKPSSASKMVAHLREEGYVDFEKYGVVSTTSKGEELGKYLLRRHDVLLHFFELLNGNKQQLEQVERAEHFITQETLENLEKLCVKMELK